MLKDLRAMGKMAGCCKLLEKICQNYKNSFCFLFSENTWWVDGACICQDRNTLLKLTNTEYS